MMRGSDVLHWLIGATAGLFLVLLGLACLTYWESPCFWDHFEAHVAAVAHRVWSGRPIYHDLDAPDRYSTVLGPNTYLWNALWQGPHPHTIPGAKTPGIVAIGLALAVLAVALGRRFGALAGLIGCGVVAMCGLMFHQFSYWNRSEPLLLLLAAVGVAGALASNAVFGAALFGAAVGLAFGTKFHAVIFFAPLLPAFGRNALGWKPIAGGWAAAAGAASSPFLLPQVSLTNHLRWLAALRGGPSIGVDLGWTTLFLALFSLPVVALVLATGEKRRTRLVCWFGPAVLLFVATALYGLERHHAMPLAVAAALNAAEWRRVRRTVAGWVLVAVFFLTAAALAVPQWSAMRGVAAKTVRCGTMMEDFERTLARTEGLRRSVGWTHLWGMSQAQVLLVFRSETPLLLDGSALMDHRKAGVPFPSATIDAIHRREVDLWLIPKIGSPWSLQHPYRSDWLVFPDEFKAAFNENYRPAGESQFYTLWLARGKQFPAPAAVP